LGLAALTIEQVQKGVDELVSNKKISKEEGRKIVEDVMQKTTSKKEELEGQFKKMAEEVMEKFSFSRNKEIEELEKRISILEAKLTISAAPITYQTVPDRVPPASGIKSGKEPTFSQRITYAAR